MSVRVMAAVWTLDLPAAEKLVLLALADCANDEGKCWPGLASLKRKTGRSRTSLQRGIRALCAAGHLSREEIPGKGCNYVVHPQPELALEGCQNGTGVKVIPVSKCTKRGVKLTGEGCQSDTQTIKNHKEPSGGVSAGADPPPLCAAEIIDAWNQRMVPLGLPGVRRMTETRKRQLRARLRDSKLEDWQRAFDALERSKFLRGENDRGWRADFDFLLQPKSFTKLLEGAYDH